MLSRRKHVVTTGGSGTYTFTLFAVNTVAPSPGVQSEPRRRSLGGCGPDDRKIHRPGARR